MTTTVSARGQIVIPAKLRKKYHIGPNSKLAWIDTGYGLRLVPIPDDPVRASRGMLKGTGVTTAELLKARQEDKELEAAKEEKIWRKAK